MEPQDFRKISEMLSLGPATQRRLAEIGIDNAQALREAGAVAAYVRLKFLFPRETTINALYAIESALIGCHWLKLDAAVKARLKAEAMAALNKTR